MKTPGVRKRAGCYELDAKQWQIPIDEKPGMRYNSTHSSGEHTRGKERQRLPNLERRTTMDKYVCDPCGYEYDPAAGDPDNGIAPGTAFEDLPEDWVCPICGASKDNFSKA